jgi:putative Holliday junction resolvase
MQVISFDFGTKKIGVAVGQTETRTSSPLQIVFSKNNTVNWNEIESIVNEWKPNLILVGKPLNMDGSDSDMMEKVDIFYKKLEKISKIPCEYVDERLTSFEARESLTEIKKDLIDAHAAKILIDQWFNNNE